MLLLCFSSSSSSSSLFYPPSSPPPSPAAAASSTASSSSTPSSPPPSSVVLMVPFAASLSIGPNVSPASVLILATGMSLVWLVSHQLTTTLSPSPCSSTLQESASVVLLKLILSQNV